MIQPAQTRLIHIALRQIGMDDRTYRLLLKNVADVASSTALNNTTFEDVMAHLEERGFRHAGKPEDHWRNRVALRGTYANERLTHKIHQLVNGTKYNLRGLVARFSGGRTYEASKLRPDEAHKLIEMLKDVTGRGGDDQPTPSPAHPLTPPMSLTPTHGGDCVPDDDVPF